MSTRNKACKFGSLCQRTSKIYNKQEEVEGHAIVSLYILSYTEGQTKSHMRDNPKLLIIYQNSSVIR